MFTIQVFERNFDDKPNYNIGKTYAVEAPNYDRAKKIAFCYHYKVCQCNWDDLCNFTRWMPTETIPVDYGKYVN